MLSVTSKENVHKNVPNLKHQHKPDIFSLGHQIWILHKMPHIILFCRMIKQ